MQLCPAVPGTPKAAQGGTPERGEAFTDGTEIWMPKDAHSKAQAAVPGCSEPVSARDPLSPALPAQAGRWCHSSVQLQMFGYTTPLSCRICPPVVGTCEHRR